MKNIYQRRPFKTRNADEFDLSQILDLFVSPSEDLASPFEFENSIIKGRMGSGKTMYLRANHAYYLYTLVPTLLAKETPILPVLIRLSDFQHINVTSEIYKAIIIKIVEELSSVYLTLQDAKRLSRIHEGFKVFPAFIYDRQRATGVISNIAKLTSEEYVEQVSSEFGVDSGMKHNFVNVSANYKSGKLTEVKSKPNPGIKDIEDCYNELLGNEDGKILLLIDEAGSLDRGFFKSKDSSSSLFEILMNQLRTASFLRTKIAIYPNSYSDILTETRYGDTFNLENNIIDHSEYNEFRKKVINIINKYINLNTDKVYSAVNLFSCDDKSQYGDSIEQLINGSNGNIRRLIQLLDSSMQIAYKENQGIGMVSLDHAWMTLKQQSQKLEDLFTLPEKEFLGKIAQVCKARSTYRFMFPNMSPAINKYLVKSQEYNPIQVLELGTGRRSTTYSFDYTYCVANDIPTHYVKETEKLDKRRSLSSGDWISRTTTVSETLIEHSKIPGKIEGSISWIKDNHCFATLENGDDYYFSTEHIIDDDQKKILIMGQKVRFYPSMTGDTRIATLVEIL